MNFSSPLHSFPAAATELFVVAQFNDEKTGACFRPVTKGPEAAQRIGASLQTKVRVGGNPLVNQAVTGLAALVPGADLGLSRSANLGA